MGIKVVAARPAENEKAKKAQQKQKARFIRLAVFNVGRIIYFVKACVLMHCVHSFEEKELRPKNNVSGALNPQYF